MPFGCSIRRYFSTSIVRMAERSKFYPIKPDPMLPKDSFDGKVAFVTGGGTGLGKGISTTLSYLGAKVAICSRSEEVLKRTAEEISKLTGNEVFPVVADVRDPSAIATAVDKCVDALGLPRLIVNNAAGNFISPTEKLSPNAWKTVVDIVLNGTAFVTLDIGKRLIEAKQGGVFLSITTTYAKTGSAFVGPSASAKAGVETLTKSLAAEWADYGLRFNCIAPGPIETKGAFSRLVPSSKMLDMLKNRILAGRLGEIQEISNLAAYLLSDYSSWMNGNIINFDGGVNVNISGEMNVLKVLTPEQWNEITSRTKKLKGS